MKRIGVFLIACVCMITTLSLLYASHLANAEYNDNTVSSDIVILGYVRVSSDSYLNVRNEASTNSKIIGKLYLNDCVEIVENVDEWYKIKYDDSYGYVHSTYIKNEPIIVLSDDVPSSDLKNSNIANLEVKYIGYLNEKAAAYPLKSTKRNCYIPAGPIAIFSIKDEYAIIAKARTLLRIKISEFDSIVALDSNADACNEPVIAAYTTFFSTSNSNRAHNISLGAEAMKTLLLPGEEYSFNRIVGKRSPEKGYLLANAYRGQEVIQDYGGGVCQLSSTLYAAIRLNPNFTITQRYTHSMEVDYLPVGMDATVNWNNRDIRFINNYPFNVYVNTYINNGMLTIMLQKEP